MNKELIGAVIFSLLIYIPAIIGVYAGYVIDKKKYHILLYWIGTILIIPLIVYGIYKLFKLTIQGLVNYTKDAVKEYKEDHPEKIKPKKAKENINSGDLSIYASGELSFPENKIKIKRG